MKKIGFLQLSVQQMFIYVIPIESEHIYILIYVDSVFSRKEWMENQSWKRNVSAETTRWRIYDAWNIIFKWIEYNTVKIWFSARANSS